MFEGVALHSAAETSENGCWQCCCAHAPPLPNLPPPPRKEQAVAGAPQVPTAEQKWAQHEAVVIAKETAYRQLIANTAVDMYGLQAEALQAECKKLHAEYNDVVKKIAKDKNIILLDLETQWYNRGTVPLFRDPTKDVIHPNEEGYRLMGKTLCDKVGGIGLRR